MIEKSWFACKAVSIPDISIFHGVCPAESVEDVMMLMNFSRAGNSPNARAPGQPPRDTRTNIAPRGSWLNIIKACRDRQRQRRALANLDDRLLADIGVTRGDAAQEAAKPFWR